MDSGHVTIYWVYTNMISYTSYLRPTLFFKFFLPKNGNRFGSTATPSPSFGFLECKFHITLQKIFQSPEYRSTTLDNIVKTNVSMRPKLFMAFSPFLSVQCYNTQKIFKVELMIIVQGLGDVGTRRRNGLRLKIGVETYHRRRKRA